MHDSLLDAFTGGCAASFTPCRRIAFVGGGGKTSAIQRLSTELLAQIDLLPFHFDRFASILCTTTTKLMHSNQMIYGYEAVLNALTHQGLVWGCAHCDEVLNKGVGFSGAEIINLSHYCLCTLVEADGSKHKPIKVFGEHEPVIDFDPHQIILVAGLSALNRPISEVLFRSESAVLYDEIQAYISRHGAFSSSTKLTRELFFATIASQLSSLLSAGVPCSILLNQADCCNDAFALGMALSQYIQSEVLNEREQTVDIVVGSVYDTP